MVESSMASHSNVAVLIPTYQGVLYLETQIKSVYEQKDVTFDLYICDDGSTDGTIELLNRLNSQFNFKVLTTTNRIGSNGAFFHLLGLVEEADYVAFCDQDDIWRQDKLISSITKLTHENSDLVFSRREYIDLNDKVVGKSPRVSRCPCWANAAVENIAYGNTQVLSKNGFNLVQSIGFVDVEHFDSWVYLLVSSYSRVSYIDECLIQYRIHKGNQVGLRNISDYVSFHKRFVNYEMNVRTLLELEELEINEKIRRGLFKFCSSARIKFPDLLARRCDWVFRQSTLETIAIRIWIFFRSYLR